ncbi:hypothetical protein ONS95_004769 [Cadophora gregata]|uniref:uncharacterized protein n=1 Tax=Cadophora gregata TaxID=51156 RepID=UPI0026DD600C|nr:uncharacterized protein ONS95_004769 [Cadophora gregata]KAK0104480.1 hypothetical protein ONS95_004769 [Cadophora gregata]
MRSNLLRSNGGIVLIPEICLQVAGEVINSDPKSAGSLLRVSKDFNSLLSDYERSISKSIRDTNVDEFAHTNADQATILSSRMPPGEIVVSILSYPWVNEMHCRQQTIEFLIEHEITDMMDVTSSSGWPTLDVPKEELSKRLAIFKRRAFLLLYRLADCTIGLTGTPAIRARQSELLESLSSDDLASLGVIVEVMGHGFFTMTKNALHASGLLNNVAVPPSSASPLYTPDTTPIEDLWNDHWIRECMCVFEDLVQKYGPAFAYAYIEGSNDQLKRPDLWARLKMQHGLDNMNAYEMGYTMSYASLQSVVWKVFCKKIDCSLQDSWTVARERAEAQMELYKV